MPEKLIDAAEVAKHNNPESCWVILYGNVYDVTDFLPSHPGGSRAILSLAGRDATEEYDPVHPSGLLESTLPPSALLGRVDADTIPTDPVASTPNYGYTPSSTSLFNPGSAYPTSWSNPSSPSSWSSTSFPSPFADSGLMVPRKVGDRKLEEAELENILNLNEFELLAKRMLSEKAWAYYSSAGDDLLSKNRNTADYRAIIFRPRVFRDVQQVDTSGSMLGRKVSLPVYVSPAAMARLGHKDGEWGIGRACGRNGMVQFVSNNASQSVEEIVRNPYPSPPADCYGSNNGQQVWGFQLYVSQNLSNSEEMLRRVTATGKYAFVALTLDAVWPGKREADERVRNPAIPDQKSAIGTGGSVNNQKGLARALFSGMASDMTWSKTLPWLQRHTSLPVVLKGIQTWEDALLASRTPGIKGIIVSNHGGRSLDTAPSPVQVLLEIRRYAPEVFNTIEVWVDGGIKRGTDVVKALCLGAKAVGIGRAALYGLGVGGIPGVERTIQILRDEVETTLRLLGCKSVAELGMEFINTKALEPLIWDAGSERDLLDYKKKAKL